MPNAVDVRGLRLHLRTFVTIHTICIVVVPTYTLLCRTVCREHGASDCLCSSTVLKVDGSSDSDEEMQWL